MSSTDRMYVIKDHEDGYRDIANLYESELDHSLAEAPGPHTKAVVVEEMTTRSGVDLVFPAVFIVERIAEDTWDGSGFEHGERWFDEVRENADVLAAAEALRQAIGKTIHFYVGDKTVAEHTITWDDDGEPLFDGERIYPPRVTA